MNGPVYTHDCDKCRYLGTTPGAAPFARANAIDHYICERCDGGTLIQRWSSQGSHYASCPTFITDDPKRYPIHQKHWAPTLELLSAARVCA